jgi:DNA-directed RNA polymerase specialized sigma subunit
MMGRKPNDREFQKLAEKIKHAIAENEGLIGDQQAQIERLVSLETKFRNDISKYSKSNEVYAKFIMYVKEDLGNILSAQSYFREMSKVFNKHISPAIKENNVQELMKYGANYQLIKFIVDNWEGELPARAQKYYIDMVETRRILIENNLPLAINRAKIFYKKTPRSHLALLDLIDICVYGLIVGVDKFSGEEYKNWAGVGIGRMVGFMIEEYSKSFIRLFPSDKKILYRANALKHRMKIENITDLVEAVNESFEKDKAEGRAAPKLPITEVQIRTLMNSSNYVSAEVKMNDGEEDGDGASIYDYTAHPDSVEEQVENKDMMEKVLVASDGLELIEKKIIRLKGVEL